ncbi:MAG: hypothetical protein KatS3mg102_1569 [Planctomycetota bacterium]|nr:MAG: hypothetical protein KatS3mg102_1569 [Planctomycetota bacterium]
MSDLVPVELKHIFRVQGHGGGVLLGNEHKSFAIFIGPGELHALVLAEGGIKPPRPLSHNLLHAILRAYDIEIHSVVIDDLVDDTYHAKLTLAQGARLVEIDCRPSDALVLARMRRSEILVTRSLLERVEDGMQLLASLRQRLELGPPGPGAPAPPPPRPRAGRPLARPAALDEGPLGDVRQIPGIDWSFLDELEA